MKPVSSRFLAVAIGLSLSLLFGVNSHAQQQANFDKVEIHRSKLADHLYTLEGQGGTISLLEGTDGILLVDSQFAPLGEKLLASIRSVSKAPIRYLVNTHLHGDHTGGNEFFARQGAVILGRDALRWRLAHPSPAANGSPGKPAVDAALPVISYDGPVTLFLDGEEVRLIPLRRAHTDGDTLVRFVKSDVLAAGDVFRSVGYPYADLNNGGSLNGLIDALGVIAAQAGPATRIVPGHGPVTDRGAVIAQRDLLLAVRDRISRLVAEGKSVEDVLAAKPTADYDDKVPQAAQGAERFVRWVYAEIKAGR